MSEKSVKCPMRMCVGCRQMFEKRSLIRITAAEDGTAHIDTTGRARGRGAYICRNIDCLRKAVKTGAIGRALSIKLDEAAQNALEKEIT